MIVKIKSNSVSEVWSLNGGGELCFSFWVVTSRILVGDCLNSGDC